MCGVRGVARWGAGVVVVWEDKRRERQRDGVRSRTQACLKHAHPLEAHPITLIAFEAKRGYFIYVFGANWEMRDGGGGRDGAWGVAQGGVHSRRCERQREGVESKAQP
jgi:hypothetical protein